MTKVTIELRGKQDERLLALALEHNKTIGGMLHAIIAEYLGAPPDEKPIRKVGDKGKGGKLKLTKSRKAPVRRKKWDQDANSD